MFEKDSIVDEFTISVGGEFHLNEEMPFEDIIFEAVKFGYNKAKQEEEDLAIELQRCENV